MRKSLDLEIIGVVERYYGIDDLIGNRGRKARDVKVRWMAVHLLHKCGFEPHDIRTIFGKSHSWEQHALEMVKVWLLDRRFAQDAAALWRHVEQVEKAIRETSVKAGIPAELRGA